MLPKRFITRVLVAVGVVIPVTVAVALASSGGGDTAVEGAIAQSEAMEGAFSDSGRPSEAVFRAGGLEPGQTVDGTVLVTNGGTQRGLFWLARTGVDDELGPIGGPLSERLQVTVLDVSVPDSPLLVYTGGLAQMGARPLGFIAPGKSRIYSVAATLLADQSAKAAAAPDPYEGSSTNILLTWSAIAGEPPTGDEPTVAPADRRPPKLKLDFPRRQRLLETASLTVLARCDERCDLSATGKLRSAGAPLPAAPAAGRASEGRAATLRVTFGPAARRAMREALTAGRAAQVKLSVSARDGAGNESATTRSLWLRPGS